MALAIGNLKECCKCKKVKSISNFQKKNRTTDGLNYFCKSCARIDYEKNREKRREYDRKFYYANRKQCIAKASRYAYKKRGKELPKRFVEHLAKPKTPMSQEEAIANSRKKVRDYKRANREKMAEAYKAYSQTERGKEVHRLRSQRRRAREANLDSSLTQEDILFLVKLQSNKCGCCKKEFNDKMKYEIDHIIPVSLGGNLNLRNVQLLCRSCNASKGTKVIRYIPPTTESSYLRITEVF